MHEALKTSSFTSEGLKWCLKTYSCGCLSGQAGSPVSSPAWQPELPQCSPHPESSRKVCGCIYFLLEAVAFEDGQPVVLEDGSMAFIHSTAKGKALPAFFLAAGEKLLKCLRFPRLGS